MRQFYVIYNSKIRLSQMRSLKSNCFGPLSIRAVENTIDINIDV